MRLYQSKFKLLVMRKITYLLLLFLFYSLPSVAQVNYYLFSQQNGTYDEITDGTVLATATDAAYGNSFDDVIWSLPADAMPFNFMFNNAHYTTCKVSSNGFITFGSTAPGNASYTPISATTEYEGAISAWGRDINGAFHASIVSNVSWKIVGTAPNRELVIQYKNVRPVNSSSDANVYAVNFQIRLQETTHIIKIVYGSNALIAGSSTTSTSGTAQVGLRGASNSDYFNRTNATTAVFSASAVGTSNTATQSFNASSAEAPGMPDNGLTYIFTPSTCHPPSAITVDNITSNTATLGWTASTSAPSQGYIYEVRTDTNPGTGTAAVAGATNAGIVTTNVTDLQPNTTYNVYVQSDCGAGNVSNWSVVKTFTTLALPVSLPYSENFEENVSNWVIVNGSETNKWFIGTAVANGGTKSLYISNNADGTTHNYSTFSTSKVHAYSDLIIPNDAANIQVSFDWRANGEGTTTLYDYITVWLVNPSYTPVAGSEITVNEDRIKIGDFNLNNNWTNASFLVNSSAYMGQNRRLIFEWKNDGGSGIQQPGAIDNIVVEKITCTIPGAISVANLTKNSAMINWLAAASANPEGYDYEIRTSGDPGSGTTGLVFEGSFGNVLTYNQSGLAPATSYKVYIRTRCSALNLSDWKLFEFTTLCDYLDLLNTTEATICGIGTAELSANFSDNSFVNWYATPTSTTSLYTGATFTTPELSSTTSFYVDAQTPPPYPSHQIGQGASTSASYSNPFYSLWSNSHTQYLIKADELTAAGFAAGNIYSVALDVTDTGSLPMLDFSLKIGTTTETTMENFISAANSVTVNTSSSLMPVSGLNILTFSAPYLWDGTSNIVLEFCHGNSESTATMNRIVKADPTTYVSVVKTHNTSGTTGSGICGNITSNKETYSVRPVFIFNATEKCNAPRTEVTVTVTPSPNLSLSANEVEVCAQSTSEPITITTGASDYDVFTWEPATGVSGDAVTGWTFTPESTTIYVLTAGQSSGDNCSKKITVLVKAVPLPSEITITSSAESACNGNIVKLEAIGGDVQTNVVIGDGTIVSEESSTSNDLGPNPFQAYYGGTKQQWIYKASELLAQGFAPGVSIHSIALDLVSAGKIVNDLKIKLKNSTTTEFTTTSGWQTDMVLVKSIDAYATVEGQNVFTLDTPFVWDGTSSLVIEMNYSNNNSGGTPYTSAKFTNTTYVSTLFYRADNTTATAMDSFTGTPSYRLNKRNNIIFNISQPADMTWLPLINLYEDEEATVAYTGDVRHVVYFKTAEEGNFTITAKATRSDEMACAVTKDIEIESNFITTPSAEPQLFCEAIPVEAIEVIADTDATLFWYSSEESTTALATIESTGVYYVEAHVGGCRTSRISVQLTIVGSQLPVAEDSQYFCDSATVADLQVVGIPGFQIKWYTSVDASSPLALTTALQTGTYYVSQSNSGCESSRLEIAVTVSPTPEALASNTYSICGFRTFATAEVGALASATVTWYSSATATQPMSSATQIVNGTYYATQTVGNCESARSAITFTVYQNLPVPTSVAQTFCGSGTVSQLEATGGQEGAEYLWYSSATATTPLSGSTALTNGTYYVSQKAGDCESGRKAVIIRVVNTTPPSVSPYSFCGSATVSDLTLPALAGVTYNWYISPASTTPLAPNTALTNGTTYFVSKVQLGCESSRVGATVTLLPAPSSPTGPSEQSFVIDIPSDATVSDLIADQEGVVWYITADDAKTGNNPLQDNMPLVSGQTYYGVVIGSNGCPSAPLAVTVTVTLGSPEFDKSMLRYYPNPVHDILTISYSHAIDRVVVYNLIGQRVKEISFGGNEVQVDMSGLSSGTYMVELHSKEQVQFIKIIKK